MKIITKKQEHELEIVLNQVISLAHRNHLVLRHAIGQVSAVEEHEKQLLLKQDLVSQDDRLIELIETLVNAGLCDSYFEGSREEFIRSLHNGYY